MDVNVSVKLFVLQNPLLNNAIIGSLNTSYYHFGNCKRKGERHIVEFLTLIRWSFVHTQRTQQWCKLLQLLISKNIPVHWVNSAIVLQH